MSIDIKIQNSKLNHAEFLEGKTALSSYPRMIFIEFTRCCNLYCDMCRPKRYMSSDLYMSREILQKIESEVVPYVEVVDVRGWGESTLDDRLLPFMKKYCDTKTINLYTNLNARNSSYWKEVSELPINIIVSIESAVSQRYALFRRGGNFKTLEKHLDIISHGQAKLFFNVVVLEESIQDIASILELAKKHNIKTIQLNPITKTDTTAKTEYPVHGFISSPEFISILENVKKLSEKYGILVEIAANLETLNSKEMKRCVHPWSYCYLRYDGKIGFCDHLLGKKSGFLGDLSQSSFKEVWNSDWAQTVRKIHRDKLLCVLAEKGVECDWCYKNRYGNFEFLLEPEISPMPLTEYIKIIRRD